MATRAVKDMKDDAGNLIYIKGHAASTYMSDGSTVESNINTLKASSGSISAGTGITFSGGVISLNKSTASAIGGVMSSNVLTSAVSLTSANGATASRYYGLQTDSTGKGFVNIPCVITNGDSTVSGKITATSFYESSDERLKNFKDKLVDIDFDKLKNIPKKYFTWKYDDDNVELGTSAQEVQKVYPEIVTTDEDGYLAVDYSKLSVIALAAIDKLYERLVILENENNKLNERLNEIENNIK